MQSLLGFELPKCSSPKNLDAETTEVNQSIFSDALSTDGEDKPEIGETNLENLGNLDDLKPKEPYSESIKASSVDETELESVKGPDFCARKLKIKKLILKIHLIVLDDDSLAAVSVYNDTDLEKEVSRKNSKSSIDLNKTHDLCQITVGGIHSPELYP